MFEARAKILWGAVSGIVAERTGLHFPEERWSDLARGLETAGRQLGFDSLEACLRWLGTADLTAAQLETLVRHLTVGETYFFRDPASFEVLEQDLLPPLIAKRARAPRSLRLWSAGCCTGEEAYSLAISCARVLPDIRAWNVSILATDINREFLAKAVKGVYSDWSFRASPPWLRERFFSPAPDGRLVVHSWIRDLVQFGCLNLAEDVFPSLQTRTNALDVVFCRNVLLYFTPHHQRRVVAALHRCLVDGGYLVVNPVEASSSLFPMFTRESARGVILFRKSSPPTLEEPRPRLVAPALDPDPVSGLEPARPRHATSPSSPDPMSPRPAAPSGDDPLARAQTYANDGRLNEALALCREVIEAERTNPASHFLYATICEELGRLEDAVAALAKVLYLDQDSILAHHALGALHRRLGKQRESKRHLAVALQLLAARATDDIVPESDGMTCGRLAESVRALMRS